VSLCISAALVLSSLFSKSNAEAKILEYLKTPLVGLLPVPHPILTRRYQENPATNLWFQR